MTANPRDLVLDITCDGVDEIINIQPDGSKAKPYQVRQIRDLIVKYHLEENDA